MCEFRSFMMIVDNHPYSLQQSSRRVHRGQDQTRPPAPPPHQNLQSQPAREPAQQGTSQKKLQQSGQTNEDQAPPVPPHQSLRPEQQQHGREGEAVGGYQHPHQGEIAGGYQQGEVVGGYQHPHQGEIAGGYQQGEVVGGYQHPHQVLRPLPPPVHFLHSPPSPLQVCYDTIFHRP